MTKEDLQTIIDQFDEADLKQQGVFGISQYGGGSDESFIRANKQGLELFAVQLLKSARDTDEIILDREKTIIHFNYEEDWIDENSDTFIQYVQPVSEKRKTNPRGKYTPTIVDKIMPFGCGLVLIIVVIAIFEGLGNMLNWIF